MSVKKSERKESELDFLYNARQLEIHTIRKAATFPKRYTFYLSQPIVASATAIYANLKRGNSIYPLNQHEVQMRRDYFLTAYAELQNLISQLEVAEEIFGIEENVMKYWMQFILSEIGLIKAIIKKDRERFKNLM